MKTRTFTQLGTVLIALFLPLFIYSLVLWIDSDFAIGSGFLLLLISLFALLCFCKLTITIDNTYVSFRMGVGFIRKRYKISDIKSAKPVRNSILRGIGIRFFSNGVLYNVSGLKAVELEFHNTERVVQIGTSQPEEVAKQINTLIDGEQLSTRFSASSKEKKLREIKLVLILVFAIVFFGVMMHFRDNVAEICGEKLVIRGMYGLSIPLSEIERIDTVSNLPRGRRTNGFGIPGTIKGHFRKSDGTRATVFVKTQFSPVIVIEQQNSDRLIYLNFRDSERTKYLYNQLKNATK